MFSFQKLEIYQASKALVKSIYRLLENFPQTEKYALCDQIRRAVVSISSNIAEGISRISPKEKAHFIEIAYGSLLETICQLEIAQELEYISIGQLENMQKEFEKLAIKLSKFRKSLLVAQTSKP